MSVPEEPSGSEQRRAKRINRRFVLRVAVFSKEPLAWSHVMIRNLSSSGIYFAYERPIQVGQMLVFKVDFPDRIIECLGMVVRVESGPGGLFSNVAAKFQGMGEAERDYIEAFVKDWRPEA